MRKIVLLCIVVTLFLSVSTPIFAIDNPAFLIKINGTLDNDIKINNQSTFVIDWQVMANRDELTLRNTQGLRLSFDNTLLQLIKWDGSGIVTGGNTGTNFSPVSQAGQVGAYNSDLRIFAAQNITRGLISISLGSFYDEYLCPKQTYVSLAQLRFAFRDGKSPEDLTATSIRCMNAGELSSTAQSSSVLLNTNENDVTSYEYLRQENGTALAGDKLNAPLISYPHGSSDNSNDIDEPYEGTSNPNNPNTSEDIPETKPLQATSDFTNPYTDVTQKAWFYNAVKYVTENGCMNGIGDNEFSPNSPITRAMFATVLYRLAGEPPTSNKNLFIDVLTGQWYTNAIIWTHENKLILGYGDGKFGIDDNLTREQAVTILNRYTVSLGVDASNQVDLSMYTDASLISAWAQNSMCWAVRNGIVSGRTTTTLVPQGFMTRAEIAQILLNLN